MAERTVGLAWRLRRAERLQTEAFDALYEKMATGSAAGGTPPQCVPEPAPDAAGGDDRLLGRMLVEDFGNARVLDRLLLYERRIEGSLYRTLRELREQKWVRLAGAPAEAVGRGAARLSRDMGLGSPTQNFALGVGSQPHYFAAGVPVPFQLMKHRQDADATKLHGRDAHAMRTPGGGMTHPLAQQSCETKPISARAGAGRVLGDRGTGTIRRERNMTKQTQSAPEPVKLRFPGAEKVGTTPCRTDCAKQSQSPGAILHPCRRFAGWHEGPGTG